MREEHVFPPSSCGLALALSQHLRLTVPRLGLPCAHSQQLVGPEALLRPPTWCGEGQCAEGSKCSWLLSSLLPFLTAWTSCHRPWIDSLHNYFLAHFRRRQWHPSPVLLPGKSHGQRSLVGCSAWGRQELDTTEQLHFHFSLFTFMHWRRKWQPTPVFLPGESQGQGSLVGCRLWRRTELDTTEAT